MKDIRFFNKDKKLMSGFKSVKIVVLRGGGGAAQNVLWCAQIK